MPAITVQVLSDLGLPAALGELADQCPVPVTVSAPLGSRMPGRIENTAYFTVAEALTNVAKADDTNRASSPFWPFSGTAPRTGT